MNRQGAVPQTMRGIPAGFGGQQQPQQSGRSVSNRIPNGAKLGSNGSSWSAFGGGVSMGGAGLQNAPRQVGAGNLSFAQSLSGSQPATPLDLSEFPSLSNTAQAANSSQGGMWSAGGSIGTRGVSGVSRQGSTPLPPQAQQEDMFTGAAGRLPPQNVFRFGNQSNINANSPSQVQPSSVDDFPPLNRSGGDLGPERGASLMSALGFGAQTTSAAASGQTNRAENGLLSALSANRGASEARSVNSGSRSQESRDSGATGSESRQKSGTLRDGSLTAGEESPQASDARKPLGAIGNTSTSTEGKEHEESPTPEVQDPLAGMAPEDKWGLKGLRTLMNNYPDYNAMVLGIDPNSLGLDLASSEPISTQIYSLFDDQPPRPAIPHFRLPECYNVNNVQPIETKISSFNEDTLFFIFYANAGDVTQHLAAQELHQRSWRWHKKLQIWLTKDEHMMPQQVSPTAERGFYIIWDPIRFQRDRREFTLHYGDLDTTLGAGAQ